MSSEEGLVSRETRAGRGFRTDFKNLADSCWRSLREAAGVVERIPIPEDIARDFSKGYMVDARIQYLGRWLAIRDEVLEHPEGESELVRHSADLTVGTPRWGNRGDDSAVLDFSHPLMTDTENSWFDPHSRTAAAISVDYLIEMMRADHSLHSRFAAALPHPLAPLVLAWQKRVEIDRRETGILPSGAARVRTEIRTLRPGSTPIDLDALGPVSDSGMGYLPGLAPSETALIEPAIPLVLWDRMDSPRANGGRGAPLALRLWIETLLSVPLAERRRHGPIRMEIPLRELVSWLWPNGWNRGRNWPQLAESLSDIHSARIPWEGGAWSAVTMANIPSGLDYPIVLDVSLPPGSERGPMIRRDVLRRWGLDSAPAYRAYLGLALLWDRYGTSRSRNGEPRRIYADVPVDWKKPGGQRQMNPARSRIPALDSTDIMALTATPNDTRADSTRRVTLKKGRAALRRMEATGDIVIEELGDGLWRILDLLTRAVPFTGYPDRCRSRVAAEVVTGKHPGS